MQSSIFVKGESGIPCQNYYQDIKYDHIYEMIISDKFKDRVQQIQSIADKKEQTKSKALLPAFTVSGTFFPKAEKASLVKYNNIFHLDFDDLKAHELEKLKSKLEAMPQVFLLFCSPSGNGIKVFFKIESVTLIPQGKIIYYHETIAWNWFYENFSHLGEIDSKCKNINRLCFFAWDASAYYNPDAPAINIEYVPEAQSKPIQPTTSNHVVEYESAHKIDWNRKRLTEIIAHLTAKNLSITNDYASWLKVCFSICNTFPDYDEAYRWFDAFSKLDESYDARAVERKFESCWKTENRNTEEKKTNFGYIFSQAKATGYVYEKKSYTDPAEVMRCLADIEEGDSRLYALLNRKYLRFDAVSDEWREYVNGKWVRNFNDTPRQMGMDRLRKAYRKTIHHYREILNNENIDENYRERLEDNIKLLRDRINVLNTVKRINNVISLSKGKLACTPNDFDGDKWKINLLNGEYDLKNYSFAPHSPTQMHTKQANVEYQTQSKCTKFILFLDRIFDSDIDIMRFIRQFFGMSLVGEPMLQGFVYCYGGGANGKSTFFQILMTLLNDYAKTVRIDLLLDRKGGTTADYEKCDLHGTRLVIASEIPKNRRLNESIVKDLTGGDTIKARQIYGKYFEFKPTHTLGLFGNHLLNITGTDNGIWRRIYLLPFKVSIPKEEQRPMDTVLAEMKTEMSGIFNWAVEGLKDFQKNGLFIPEVIRKATEDYKSHSDVLTPFIENACEIVENAQVGLKDLYQAYKQFCAQEGEEPYFNTKQKFTKAIIERGFEKSKDNYKRTFFIGLKLKV